MVTKTTCSEARLAGSKLLSSFLRQEPDCSCFDVYAKSERKPGYIVDVMINLDAEVMAYIAAPLLPRTWQANQQSAAAPPPSHGEAMLGSHNFSFRQLQICCYRTDIVRQ